MIIILYYKLYSTVIIMGSIFSKSNQEQKPPQQDKKLYYYNTSQNHNPNISRQYGSTINQRQRQMQQQYYKQRQRKIELERQQQRQKKAERQRQIQILRQKQRQKEVEMQRQTQILRQKRLIQSRAMTVHSQTLLRQRDDRPIVQQQRYNQNLYNSRETIIYYSQQPIRQDNNIRVISRQTIPSRLYNNIATTHKTQNQVKQAKRYQNFYEDQDQDIIEEISLHEVIVNQNKFILQYPAPGKNIKIWQRFKSQQQYIQILSQLLKYEVITNINQAIDKKYDIKPQLQYGILGKFKKIQKKRGKTTMLIPVFIPNKQQDQIKLAKILLKGQKACIASPHQKLNSQGSSDIDKGICEICIVKYKLRQKSFQVVHKQNSRFEKLVTNIYLFDLDPIITGVRAMNAINFVKNSLHSKRIINPNYNISIQNNQIRTRFLQSSTMQAIQSKRNASQIKTIQQILSNRTGIHLVQGPPGTGKTSTILNFISAQLQCLQTQRQNKIIMVCSESNAAIDDIGLKIKEQGLLGRNIRSNEVLRLGQVTLASQNLIEYNLKHICERQMGIMKTSVQLQIQIEKLEQVLKTKSSEGYKKLKTDIRSIEKNILQINQRIQNNRGQFNQIQKKKLQCAKVILSTLSSSGRTQIIAQFQNRVGCLIIDQACQTTQPHILIPFLYQPRKVVLVGDPKQLQATVISRNHSSKYSRSLFERFIDCCIQPAFLNTQYRMVPQISQFSNERIYEGRIINGRTKGKPNSFKQLSHNFEINSILFIDVAYGKEQCKNKSYSNQEQVTIISLLARKFAVLDKTLTLGIISPYANQTKALQSKLFNELPSEQMRKNIKISTVDAFQGQQRDIILITCVRANLKGDVGFVSNERRLNVALTRAKNAIIVVGNQKTLSSKAIWKQYIKFNKNQNSFIKFESLKSGQDKITTLFYRKPIRTKIDQNIIDQLFN